MYENIPSWQGSIIFNIVREAKYSTLAEVLEIQIWYWCKISDIGWIAKYSIMAGQQNMQCRQGWKIFDICKIFYLGRSAKNKIWYGCKISNIRWVAKYCTLAGQQNMQYRQCWKISDICRGAKYSTLAGECLEHLAFAAVGCWTFGSRNPTPSKLR